MKEFNQLEIGCDHRVDILGLVIRLNRKNMFNKQHISLYWLNKNGDISRKSTDDENDKRKKPEHCFSPTISSSTIQIETFLLIHPNQYNVYSFISSLSLASPLSMSVSSSMSSRDCPS